MSDHEKLICLAMDAFRLCIGLPPRNFTPSEIAAFIANRLREAARTGPWGAVPYGALRERIAHAIYDADRVVGVRPWADAPAATREDCYVCAEAALAAMAEPTEAARTGPWGEERPVRAALTESTSEEVIDALRLRIAHLEIHRGRGPITARLHELECMRVALRELEDRTGPWGET